MNCSWDGMAEEIWCNIVYYCGASELEPLSLTSKTLQGVSLDVQMRSLGIWHEIAKQLQVEYLVDGNLERASKIQIKGAIIPEERIKEIRKAQFKLKEACRRIVKYVLEKAPFSSIQSEKESGNIQHNVFAQFELCRKLVKEENLYLVEPKITAKSLGQDSSAFWELILSGIIKDVDLKLIGEQLFLGMKDETGFRQRKLPDCLSEYVKLVLESSNLCALSWLSKVMPPSIILFHIIDKFKMKGLDFKEVEFLKSFYNLAGECSWDSDSQIMSLDWRAVYSILFVYDLVNDQKMTAKIKQSAEDFPCWVQMLLEDFVTLLSENALLVTIKDVLQLENPEDFNYFLQDLRNVFEKIAKEQTVNQRKIYVCQLTPDYFKKYVHLQSYVQSLFEKIQGLVIQHYRCTEQKINFTLGHNFAENFEGVKTSFNLIDLREALP